MILIKPIIIGLITSTILFFTVLVVNGFLAFLLPVNFVPYFYLTTLGISLVVSGYITAINTKSKFITIKLFFCCIVGFLSVVVLSLIMQTSGVWWLELVFSIAGAGLCAIGGFLCLSQNH